MNLLQYLAQLHNGRQINLGRHLGQRPQAGLGTEMIQAVAGLHFIRRIQ